MTGRTPAQVERGQEVAYRCGVCDRLSKRPVCARCEPVLRAELARSSWTRS